jgi:hypothetical protein
MTIPGFSAGVSIYHSTVTYFTGSFGISADGVAVIIQPQFRSRVRRQCGPCVNGTRYCFLWGYECSVVEGGPGSPDIGIPPGQGHLRCEPGYT